MSKRIFLFIGCFVGHLFLGCSESQDWKDHQDVFLKKLLDQPDFTQIEISENMSRYADVFRARGIVPKEFENPDLYKVTHEYGRTIIDLNQLPLQSGISESPLKPWSSWWFPKFEDALFKGSSSDPVSPLRKYDLYRKNKFKIKSQAADLEASGYNPNAQRWEGLCDAWAFASILSAEPRSPVKVGKVGFSVGDQKALLLKTYEGIDDASIRFYGQKFTGDYTSWIHPDPFPDQLHRFIEVQIFQNKAPFVMDHDAGVQVWNEPVYKANYSMQADPQDSNAVVVRAWLYSATTVLTNERDFIGIKEMMREYNYVLYGDRDSRGMLTVTSGIWIKSKSGVDSRMDHPDYMGVPDVNRVAQKSLNPEIDVSVVNEILGRAL